MWKTEKNKKHLLELKISTCKCLKPFDIHFTLTEDKEKCSTFPHLKQNFQIFARKITETIGRIWK